MKQFQHLKYANSFPSDDVKPFQQYQNTFDYDRWTAETVLKPCSVRWTLTTNDRVKWDNDVARNKYFDNLTSNIYTLDSMMNRIVSGESVKLPIPWQSIQCANYLEVQVPEIPNENHELDYSTNLAQRIYYFIVDSKYLSPSVTECVLVRDNWTTYINHINIPRIELERGHQAIASSVTPTEFLKNPIANTTGLTDDEPNAPALPVKTTNNKYYPLGSGEMWLLLSIKCNFNQLSTLTKAGAQQASTAPTFSNSSEEWGQDYVVNNYYWGDLPDVSNITTPLATLITGGGTVPIGETAIAIKATDTTKLVKMINDVYPQLWNMISAAFVLPKSMFETWDAPITLEGVNIYHVRPQFEKSLANLTLNKTDFAYSNEYANLTKLYTSPYAWLAVTNTDTGETATIRIEDTTNSTTVKMRVNLAYPYLRAQTFLTGISGNQSVSYEWRDYDNNNKTAQIDAGAFTQLTTHEIPTFNLYVDSEKIWNLNNANAAKSAARDIAIRNYHSAERSTNVAQINSNNNAETVKANTTASANTTLNTTTASANTSNSNVIRSANTTTDNANLTNVNRSDLTQAVQDNDRANQVALYGEKYTPKTTNFWECGKLGKELAAQIEFEGHAYSIGQEFDAITNMTKGGMLTVGAALAGGPLAGALALADAGVNATFMATKNTNLFMYHREHEESNWAAAMVAQQQIWNAHVKNLETTRDKNNEYNTNTTANNVKTSKENSAATTSTNISNATASKNTTVANATATYNTGVANTNRTRDAATFANQMQLMNAQSAWTSKLADLRRVAATQIATSSGDCMSDAFGTRGVQVRVMTQNDDTTRRYGDDMLRYGYTWHVNVEQPELNLMKLFTYWRGDAQIIPVHAPTQAVSDIQELFNVGVTVWRDADMIGSSIYNNLKV